MITAALALMFVQAVGPAAAPSEEAVAEEMASLNTVLEKFQGGVYKKDGKLTCRLEQSSGDQAIDLLGCGSMVGCYAPRVEDLDAIAASDASAEKRKTEMQAVMNEVQPCIAKAHELGVRRIAIVRVSN